MCCNPMKLGKSISCKVLTDLFNVSYVIYAGNQQYPRGLQQIRVSWKLRTSHDRNQVGFTDGHTSVFNIDSLVKAGTG